MKPISSGVAGERRRQRLARLADVLRDRRHRQLAVGEAQPERRVALRHQRDAADHVEQLFARQRQLVLELLGQQLPVVRELAVDAARREPRAVGAEHDVVLVHAELDLVGVAGDPRELLQRACRDDRLELGQRPGDGRLLDGEAVRIGRGHHDLARLEANEDAR